MRDSSNDARAEACRQAASSLADAKQRSAASLYSRERDLVRLVPFWPHELRTQTPAEHLALIAKIRRALRRERQRGTRADWTYDLARHTQLLGAYRAEIREFLKRGTSPATSRGAFPDPSSSPDRSGPARNSVRPSDSRAEGPTSPDTPPATCCSGSGDDASGT